MRGPLPIVLQGLRLSAPPTGSPFGGLLHHHHVHLVPSRSGSLETSPWERLR